MRYATQFFPNPLCAELHFGVEVPRLRFEYGRLSSGLYGPGDDELAPGDEALGLALSRVPGVEKFSSFHRYSLGVTRGGAFAWGDVLPAVAAAVRDHLAPGGPLEEVPFGRKPSAADGVALFLAEFPHLAGGPAGSREPGEAAE